MTANNNIKLPVYLDYQSTTPLDPRVFEAMTPYFLETFGNAASRNHSFGWTSEEAVDYAREQIAKLIGASEKELIFTSGATESNNLALKGVFEMYARRGNHIITATTEHKAVLDACAHLEKQGAEVTYLPVKEDGMIDLELLRSAIKENTILVSIMYGNNELGVVQNIREIGAICKEKGVLFHSDATQAVGKIPVDVIKDNIATGVSSADNFAIRTPGNAGAYRLLFRRRKSPDLQRFIVYSRSSAS